MTDEELLAGVAVALAYVRRPPPFDSYVAAKSNPPRMDDDPRSDSQIKKGEGARANLANWQRRRDDCEAVLMSMRDLLAAQVGAR